MTSPSKSLSAAIRLATSVDIPALTELDAGLFAEGAGTRDPFVAAEWPGRDTGAIRFYERFCLRPESVTLDMAV